MRKRIQQLARGKFEYARPILSFSTDKVEIEVSEGKDYTGDFVITSANHVPMRGVIYTSNGRMECLTPQFEGEEVRIRYQFHSNGLVEGDIQKGEFYMICSQGEYNLSFVASVSRMYAKTSVGSVRSLNDFAELAKRSLPEAQHLFYSKNFKNIIKPDEGRERLCYEGLARGGASAQKVEEFLVAIHKKKAVRITPAAESAAFYEVTETHREILVLQREHWGNFVLLAESDADFLVPVKEQVTEEDFIGSTCAFAYDIREEALHAGRNYGRLTFRMPGGEFRFEVCASRGSEEESGRGRTRREIGEGRVELAKLYMDYRLKKIVTGVWANRSIELLDHLMAMRPEDGMYPLMKAQALLINKQKQEAAWILDDYKRNSGRKNTPEWGYYLYLRTLQEREPSFVDRMAAEIEELFQRYPDSSLLFWILLFLKDSYYRSNAGRYQAIGAWMAEGNRSPYLYLEAYYLLWQDPYLLGKLGNFEIAVLNWAVKQHALNAELAAQILEAVPRLHGFHPAVCRILEECCRVCKKEEMLAAFCGYLIRNQRYDHCYHKWYELGIEREIRLTGLYEAYLMSMDVSGIREVPKVIQMYFQYDSALPYRQKAALLVNIIAAKKRQPDMYQRYRRGMELFAMEQIEAGHMDENLAVIYDEMLLSGVFSEELAHRLTGILFTHRLLCANRQVARAQIWQEELKEPQTVPVVNGMAYFTAYTQNYVVVLEDTGGRRFCESGLFEDEPLMHPELYLEKCLLAAPKEWQYALLWYEQQEQMPVPEERRQQYLTVLLLADEIATGFKQKLLLGLLEEYKRSPESGAGRQALGTYLAQTDLETLPVAVRRRLVELLAAERLYEKAYRMVQTDGYDYLESGARVALCSYAITEGGFEEDDFLLGFAADTFAQGKYNDVMLIYLCKYYNAATKRMEELWQVAGEFQIDTFDLEERILTQMLYTTEYTPYIEQIYDSYYAGGGRETLCLAYLSYFADGYLRQDVVVPGHVFVQIRQRWLEKKELNDACRLALLKHFAEWGSLTETQLAVADGLLAEYVTKNICFAFYRKLDPRLVEKYHLYDRFFIEHHAGPGRHIRISYRMEEEAYRTQRMTEMYPGIYVKELLLFFGETVQYYISEEQDEEAAVIESGCISNSEVTVQEQKGRYAWLNEMLLAGTLGDMEKLEPLMHRYERTDRLTELLFRRL